MSNGIIWIDGFDEYTGGSIQDMWDTTSTSNSFTTGRFAGQAAQQSNSLAIKTLPASYGTLIYNVALKFTALLGSATNPFLQFKDAGTAQCDVRLNASNQIIITRNGTAIGPASSFVPTVNVWFYLTWKVTFHASAGTIDLWINNVSDISATGLNTKNSSNATANQVVFTFASNSYNVLFDDLYIQDGSVGGFVGDARVDIKAVSGDGATTNLTQSTGGTHFGVVDEAPPNDDTDYESSGTPGDIGLYTFPAFSLSGPILALVPVLRHRKDDAGTRQIAAVVRSGGTNYIQATKTCTAGYLYSTDILEQDPATSAAWTLTGLNSAQIGEKVIA